MIVSLNKSETNENKLGNKGKFLLQLIKADFPVPEGFVLDSDVYFDFIKQNNINNKIKNCIDTLDKNNISEISDRIISLFDKAVISESIKKEIEKRADDRLLYAVRSSGTMEDMVDHSFAGQYDSFLNVKNSDICCKVIECYKSMFKEIILSYLVDNSISADKLGMSVVVQRMIEAEISGICFTVNPSTGSDKEMLIEVSEGLGENIVSGKTAPQQYYYNWYEDVEVIKSEQLVNRYLSKEQLSKAAHCFKNIQQYFGYPCDIEFAIKGGDLYILQSRAITKLKYTFTPYIWTTADFKDGGVSATICTPYMWSLYEYIWEYSLRKFIVDSKILRDNELPKKLGEMFYGRPYWNMTAVKKTMSQIVHYKEREFDNEYGIIGNYEGDGQTTSASPKYLIKILRIVYHQTKLLNDRRKNSERYKSELLDKYYEYKKKYDSCTIGYITVDFYELTHNIYLRSETTYFWQIFINTIHQSLYKDSLLKYVSESEYLSLLASIENISHLLPFYDMWTISRTIRNDSTAFEYWKNESAVEISKKLDTEKYCMKETAELIGKYGYHSDKELDITYPCYYEEPQTIIQMLKDMVVLDDSFSPEKDKEQGKQKYLEILKRIEKDVSKSEYKKIVKKIENMRSMLWWREEFRDVSTRFYYLLRVYTIEYAKYLEKNAVLEKWEDVWFLKIGDLWDHIDKKLSANDLNSKIKKNKLYYNAYRNYMSENEIGSDFSVVADTVSGNVIKGLGANNGRVTATARVVKDLTEIDRLQQGDILITKFTDTGWTPKFAILAGIVTEYGGILCHAAIVAREYGIPAIVCCKDALSKITDGQKITIDGAAGTVIIDGGMKE